jgi:hypothetical protein
MPGLNDNPFAVLTAVVAPAILTNACSVLSLGTANRMGRVVDRTRVVSAARASLATGSPEYKTYSRQLELLQTRGKLLVRALRIFYAALGAFAASALTAVVGSALAAYELQTAFHAAAVIGFGAGSVAVSALVAGCALMVRETRLAIRGMIEEIELARTTKVEVPRSEQSETSLR